MNKINKKTELFANKRARLRAEMEVAEELLKDNISGIRVLDYLIPSSSQILPNVAHTLKQKPANFLVPLDLISRQFLSEKHWMRKVVTFINSLGFLFK